MGVLAGFEIAAVAIKAIDKAIDLFPNFEQKQIQRWKYLKDNYEIEFKKPRYDESKTDEENQHARSEDRLLNLRDQCMRYGETLIDLMGQSKG